MEHFQAAFSHVMPSVSKKDQRMYLHMKANLSRARSRASTAAANALSGDEVANAGAPPPQADLPPCDGDHDRVVAT